MVWGGCKCETERGPVVPLAMQRCNTLHGASYLSQRTALRALQLQLFARDCTPSCLIPTLLIPSNTSHSKPTQVGVPVDHDAVPKMIIKYQALLDKLAASDMPPSAQYRINVEKIARYRIAAAQNNLDDPEKVEELCNCGQVEELVIQADNEMKVMDMYLRNRWWELVKPVEIELNPNHEDDHGELLI